MSVAGVIWRVAAAIVLAAGVVPLAHAQDTAPPVLVSFDFDPQLIDITGGGQSVEVTVGATDDLSGLAVIEISFMHGSASGQPSIQSCITAGPSSGTQLDGLFQCTVYFPQFSPTGIWTVEQVILRDQIGNAVNATAELTAGGWPVELSVVSVDIEVTPIVVDFGDADIGLPVSQMVTITNVGSADLVVTEIDFDSTGGGDFSTSAAPILPATILPDETADIEVAFAPTVLGETSAIIQIGSNDPDQPVVEVLLNGTGVAVDPSDTLGTILVFFDQSVADGTLVGSGPGASGPKRLAALRNRLEASGDLLDKGLIQKACNQLLDAYLRTDGLFPPPDFVAGTAAPELATQIQDLRTSLGCDVQCGDVNRGGDIGPEDTDRARDYLVRLTPEAPFELPRCSVSGEERACHVGDLAKIRRWIAGLAVSLQNSCSTANLDPGNP